jgi:thiosulfate/3-mercaptopyruvate sulfurtransferase
MKAILFTLVLIASCISPSFSQESAILVSPQWLNEHQKDPNLVIVQVNFMKMDYVDEHIAGARYLWPAWLAPDSPEGAMNEPDVKKATEVIESMGISNDSHVVLVHVRNEVSPASRMFLTFENFGMKGKVSFLNGGLDAWKKAGYPVTKELPVYKKGKFKAILNPVIVDRYYVLNHLHSDSVTIVDARMARFYNGDVTGNPRDGHIAGAKNIPYTEMVDANNVFKPNDQLQTYFSAVTDTKNKELVTYCFIGQTASVVYLAGRILGYPMKLYDGSLQEWSRIKELPMEMPEKKPDNKP